MLTKLAVHYYRPDFSEGQAKSLIRDMVEDLSEFSLGEIDAAIKTYRRNSENRFFPTSGALRGPILAERKEQREAARISTKPLPDSRPIRWWSLSPYLWKPHWQESDIPMDERTGYFARLKAKRAEGAKGWAVEDFAGLARKQAK